MSFKLTSWNLVFAKSLLTTDTVHLLCYFLNSSRTIVICDCFQLNLKERKQLKESSIMKCQKYITKDAWRNIQIINHMNLTA